MIRQLKKKNFGTVANAEFALMNSKKTDYYLFWQLLVWARKQDNAKLSLKILRVLTLAGVHESEFPPLRRELNWLHGRGHPFHLDRMMEWCRNKPNEAESANDFYVEARSYLEVQEFPAERDWVLKQVEAQVGGKRARWLRKKYGEPK